MTFLEEHRRSTVEAREAAAVERLIVPPIWRVPVALGPFQGWFRASATYLQIDDGGSVYMPLSALGAQAALDKLAGWDACCLPWLLPTPKMADAVWQEAAIRAEPRPIPPDAEMTSLARFYAHDAMVHAALDRDHPGWGNFLSAGMKKDLVLTNRLVQGRVAIYGWHKLDGSIVQPLNASSHDDRYADYSHGVRAIHPMMEVNGEEMRVADVLRSHELAGLLSGEGPLRNVRQPGG